jgi:hypothetical protein
MKQKINMLLFNPERPLETTILIYLIVLGALFLLKPKFLFDPKGNLKKFATGAGNHKTILPLWLIIALIGIVIYYIVIVFNYRIQMGGLCRELKKGGSTNIKDIEKMLNIKC